MATLLELRLKEAILKKEDKVKEKLDQCIREGLENTCKSVLSKWDSLMHEHHNRTKTKLK